LPRQNDTIACRLTTPPFLKTIGKIAGKTPCKEPLQDRSQDRLQDRPAQPYPFAKPRQCETLCIAAQCQNRIALTRAGAKNATMGYGA